MSWDAIKGIREGEQNAKASARAKRRGAKLAGGGGGGKSRSGFTRAQGRAAVSRIRVSGRGIAIKSLKNGSSFKDTMDYNNNPAKSAKIVSTNCGDSLGALQAMLAASRQRPDIKNPVGKIVLSLPPIVGKNEKRWTEIVNELREQIGLDDSFPYITFQHADQPHDHLHLEFSRCSITGKVHDQRNIGLRCAAAEQVIEQRFNLHLVPPSEFKNANTRVSKNEIEMGLRKGVQPPRMQIAASIKAALQGNPKPSTAQFIERLQSAGVGVSANVASTGKMNGFSFTYDGIAFTASKISKEYGWKSLSTKIDFDPERDAEFLASMDGGLGTASRDLTMANCVVYELANAVSSVSTEKGECHEQQNRDVAQTAGIDSRTSPAGGGHAEPATAAGERDHALARIGTSAPDAAGATGQPAPAVDRAIPRVEPTAPARPVAPAPVAGRAPGRNAVVSNRVVAGRRAELVDAAVSANSPVIINPPDLKTERWARSAQLLSDYRNGMKSKTDLADLDRLASDAGHDPADIISSHATVTDHLPSQIAQDVLRNAPTPEMREYIDREFKAAKSRFESRKDDKLSDQPGMRPKGM
jgi:hypothetical protein